jgi:hypothetical protein
MIDRLVVGGCSYMEQYSAGQGHHDLAQRLGLYRYYSLAHSGSCNDRILRSVLRDCLSASEPSLYIVGLTFLHRYELPILAEPTEDGLWQSCTGHLLDTPGPWRSEISLKEYNNYSALRAHMFYLKESLEKTMFWALAAIHTVKNFGHRIIMFNTAEAGVDNFLNERRFQSLNIPEIVGGYRWRSIQYQIDNGAQWCPQDSHLDLYVRHVAPGQHQWLNDFLTNYIHEHKILQ